MALDTVLKTSMKFEYGKPSRMSANVARVVANNPGPYTFKGTNTYIVGTESVAVIDPGPRNDEHLAATLAAIDGRPVSHILLTHRHRDHTENVDVLRTATGARVFAYGPIPFTGPDAIPTGRSMHTDLEVDAYVTDGDRIEGEGWTLNATHTPGHAPDHLCFSLEEDNVLFSGDHVMAWSTTVVSPPDGRMADYLTSLQRLLKHPSATFLPAHGGRVEAPNRLVKAYLLHRQWRENSIAEAIRNGHTTVTDIVALLYKDLDDKLLRAATRSVQAHIVHMMERDIVRCESHLEEDATLALTEPQSR